MNCTAGSELLVLTQDGSVHRCRACAKTGVLHPQNGPCPIKEACRNQYPSDTLSTRRTDGPVNQYVRIICHPGVALEELRRQVSNQRKKKITIVFDVEDGDTVSFDALPDLMDYGICAFADIEIRTTLMAKDVRYVNLLKRSIPGCVKIIPVLRTYVRGFDWFHFIGRALMSVQRGFETKVIIPLHPLQAGLVPGLKGRLTAKGLPVEVEVHPDHIDEFLLKIGSKPTTAHGDFENI